MPARRARGRRRHRRRRPARRRGRGPRARPPGASDPPREPSPSASAASAPATEPESSRVGRRLVAGDRAGGVDARRGHRREGSAPEASSQRAFAPAWSSSEVAGTVPPETAMRSQRRPCSVSGIHCPDPSSSATTAPLTRRRPIAADHGAVPPQRDAGRREPRLELRVAGLRARVGDRRDLDAGSPQREGGLEAAVGRRGDHRSACPAARRRASRAARRRSRASRPGCRCPRTSAAARSSPSPRRGCGRGSGAGCSRTRPGTRPSKNPSAAAGASTSTPASRTRAPSSRDAGGEIAGERAAAELGAVVDQDHVRPQLGRPQRGAHPRHATPDHEHVGVPAAVLRAPFAVRLAARQPAQAGRVAEHLLVERPEPARADEGLVVEARRRQPAAEEVGAPHQVEPQRRARVHVCDRACRRAPARCRRGPPATRRPRPGS